MKKSFAIELLGGSIPSAAKAINVSYQAVNQWPDDLSKAIEDRVFAAFVRLHPADWQSRWPGLIPPQPAIAPLPPAPGTPEPSRQEAA